MDNIFTSVELNKKIKEIKLFKYNIYAKKSFSFGTWTSRQHAFISISCVESDDLENSHSATADSVLQAKSLKHIGYGENIMSTNNPEIDLNDWGNCFNELKGLSVKDALLHVQENLGVWGHRQSEMAEIALIDLAGKLLSTPATKLLDLYETKPIYGVYVILSDDIKDVKEKAKWAKLHGRTKFIKVKLFGDVNLDSNIIKAVREEVGSETFLIGDVNGGYGMEFNGTSASEIAKHMKVLYEAGLDACEDPAYMDDDKWVELQSLVGELSLIPDYPMRPAWKAYETVKDGMGRIYNIHPGCMGSIIEAVKLSKKIKNMGAKLMIGDDSLIGPGCTIWQQVAGALEADWVEAIEKDVESDIFNYAVKNKATKISLDGQINFDKSIFGFGLELDEKALFEKADSAVVIS